MPPLSPYVPTGLALIPANCDEKINKKDSVEIEKKVVEKQIIVGIMLNIRVKPILKSHLKFYTSPISRGFPPNLKKVKTSSYLDEQMVRLSSVLWYNRTTERKSNILCFIMRNIIREIIGR